MFRSHCYKQFYPCQSVLAKKNRAGEPRGKKGRKGAEPGSADPGAWKTAPDRRKTNRIARFSHMLFGNGRHAKYLKKGLIFQKTYSIIFPVEQTESCPSWSKEHDWKSCKPSKRLRGFESLALRQKPMKRNKFRRLSFFAFCSFPRRRKPPKTTS